MKNEVSVLIFFFLGLLLASDEVCDQGECDNFSEIKEVVEILPEWIDPNDDNIDPIEMYSEIYTSVKRFQCFADIIPNSELLVYGTKSWTFSEQDVELVLTHPYPEDIDDEEERSGEEYLITGIQVVLYINGHWNKGFITRGGILQKQIEMKFVCHRITSLAYQFWLYGVPSRTYNRTGNPYRNRCSVGDKQKDHGLH